MPDSHIPYDLGFCRWMAVERGVIMMPNSLFYNKNSPFRTDQYVRLSICKGLDHSAKAVMRIKGKVKTDWFNFKLLNNHLRGIAYFKIFVSPACLPSPSVVYMHKSFSYLSTSVHSLLLLTFVWNLWIRAIWYLRFLQSIKMKLIPSTQVNTHPWILSP